MKPRLRLVQRGLFSITLIACVAAAQATRAQTTQIGSDLRVTVVGCIQRTQPGGGDVPATTVVPAGQTKYVLSNITLVHDTKDPAPVEATIVAQAVKMYRLDDASDSLIAAHVGERVQASGTVVAPPPAGTAGRSDRQSGAAPQAPLLRVDTLKTIARDSSVCSH